MASIPREPTFDSSLALLSDGYTFISKRCRRHHSDLFETRLMLRKVICTTGVDAARMFYTPNRFTRQGAMPITTLRLLQDEGSVATLDADAHRHRKQMFMDLMTPAAIDNLIRIFARHWRAQVVHWAAKDHIVLHDAAREVLCRAICEWTGVPLGEDEAEQRTRELGAMIDGAGSVGPRNWFGQGLRRRTEHWIHDLIEAVRAGKLDAPAGSALDAFAHHRDLNGQLLDADVAVVELLNLLRPTVAVARYIVFAALALHENPNARQEIGAGNDVYRHWFVQEVRRFYPFFPFIGGRARHAFEWNGHHFAEDTWVLLDLYGTNHDPRLWDDVERFRPERFAQWDESAYDFIPQGGGEFIANHRCAGEWITVRLLETTVSLLVHDMHYHVPAQDVSIDLSQMPALPKSGFVMGQIRGA